MGQDDTLNKVYCSLIQTHAIFSIDYGRANKFSVIFSKVVIYGNFSEFTENLLFVLNTYVY